jgi:predicted protein tyrosine phosphatase
MDDRKRRKPVGPKPKRRGLPPKDEVIVRVGSSRSRAPARRPAVRMNFDWLTDRIAVGGWFAAETAEMLAGLHGITRVVDLRGEDCDDELALARNGMRLLHLPTEDSCAVAPEAIERGVEWVRAALRARHRILIHCQHGIGRSALLALCVMVDSGIPPLMAMTLAKDARAVVSPSPEQLQAFMAFATTRSAGQAWTVPSFEELASIAYRHLAWKAGEVGSGTAGA